MKSGTAIENRGSILLKPEENEQLFSLIGNRCQCLAAGVIQLYETEPPMHKEWIKKNTGIITLIRDTSKRSFFLRLYCIQRNSLIWEHEVYHSMDYKAPENYFHTFEGEKYMTAFNFANETDAIVLWNVLIEKLNSRRNRRQSQKQEHQENNQSPQQQQGANNTILPNKMLSASTPILGYNQTNGSSSLSINKSTSNISSVHKKDKKNKKNQESKRKLTTNDIGLPFDFRHVKHVGNDFTNSRVVEPELQAFFDKVGISETHLENQETRNFIYNFIESYGGMNAVKEEIVPPPIPARSQPPPAPITNLNSSHQRKAPPLPPNQTHHTQAPPTPPNMPSIQRTLPSRPPPPTSSTQAPSLPPPPPPPITQPQPKSSVSAVPPPPPPPMPDSTVPLNIDSSQSKLADSRSMLMESIRTGTTLKKLNIEEIKSPVAKDSRSNLLDEIRQGITLKPVSNEPRPTSAGTTSNKAEGGLAAALTRALAERSRAMYSESESSDSDFSDNDDEWDD